MTAAPDVHELSLMLADHIEQVVDALNLDVKERSRRTLYCFPPWNGHHKPKLEVETYPKAGKWNDWIEGQYGDALSLVGCVVTGRCEPKSKAVLRAGILWAKDYFGLEAAGFDKEAWARRKAEAQKRREAADAKARRELAEKRKTAEAKWLASEELKPGTAGWAYLAARGIDLAKLPRQPRAIRFSPAEPWHDTTGEVRHIGPALMSAMTLPDGKFGSLHRIWIDPNRPGQKADLSHISDTAPVRKMWPESEGAVIRLWRGESGLAEKEAAKRGVIEDLVVCEGVEDGLSIALMTPELRVVAAGSLPGLTAFIPPKHVRRVIVAADNDWGKPHAQALLNRACERLTTECHKDVSIARSPEGKDFNDLLRGE